MFKSLSLAGRLQTTAAGGGGLKAEPTDHPYGRAWGQAKNIYLYYSGKGTPPVIMNSGAFLP